MKKILAVSGGVDSVVMLHMFRNDSDVIVAHFNHGIRANSTDDCIFVEKLAEKYQIPFISKQAMLGADCSEEDARLARYLFLNELAEQYHGKIYTAHHADDLIESVLINLIRGTGWRGLAVLNNPSIVRPLIKWTKNDIYKYAAENNLHFRLDQTNSDEHYLRNRIRIQIRNIKPQDKEKLYSLAMRQREIATEIDQICANLPRNIFPRNLMNNEDPIAIEVLRAILAQKQISQTRPQLQRGICAIRTYAPGKRFPLNKKHTILIDKYNFRIIPTDCAKE